MKERVGLGTQVAFTVLGRRNTWAGLAQRLAEGVCCRCELRGRTEEERRWMWGANKEFRGMV